MHDFPTLHLTGYGVHLLLFALTLLYPLILLLSPFAVLVLDGSLDDQRLCTTLINNYKPVWSFQWFFNAFSA